jgi:NADP-dependent 3-hydroxy acid dehydrogenase YdfG
VQNGQLSGKTAVVVGASSGIGLATANLFADEGAVVHAAARRREAIEEGAGERIGSGRVKAHELDVSDAGAVERAIGEIGAAGGIDVLVCAASLPYLREVRGFVILVSSVSGAWPDMSGPAYQASKAGMTELAYAAGFEEHQNGVRFSSIMPGIVDTPILDSRPEPPNREIRDLSLKPVDVATACLFLATLPERAYVPELTILPTEIQALGKTSAASPPVSDV